jgi:repressor LexA
MQRPLTDKQRQIYDFIATAITEKGFCPTLREIGEKLHKSVGTIQEQTKALVKKGLLGRRGSGGARAFYLTHPREDGLPVLGRVGAGGGVVAQEDVEKTLTFLDISSKTNYLLRVRGDSMDRAGIFDGDLVRVRKQAHAEDGDLVVALTGEEGVVKRLRKRPGHLALESANPKYRPITGEFKIIGAVVGLVRSYPGGA